MHTTYQSMRGDGDGYGDDGGEHFHRIVTSQVARGWSADEIEQNFYADRWRYLAPRDWSGDRVRREIESCGAKPGPPPAAPAVEVARVVDDGIPGWLRSRIETLTIPADRDQYFRDVVGALVGLGWDTQRITIEVAGRPWVPDRYSANASRHLEEWGVGPIVAAAQAARADSRASLRVKVAPNAAAAVVEVAVQTNVADVSAGGDLHAVQAAIAGGRWRKDPQAKAWVGHAVAAALKLDVETDRATIVELLKTWIGSGALVVVEGEDEQRKTRKFVEVGSAARCDENAEEPR